MKIRIEFARLGQDITSCFLYGEHDVTEFLNVFLFHYHKDGFAKNMVYLLYIENGDELFVTQNIILIKELLEGKVAPCPVLNKTKEFVIFLQEYESYEEAYEVALLIKEINPLCYNNPINN
jgi:hypothetical protein